MNKILIVIILVRGSEFIYKISSDYMIQYCPSIMYSEEYGYINVLNRKTDDYSNFQSDGTKLYQTKVSNDVSGPAWVAADLELVKETFKVVEDIDGRFFRREQVRKMNVNLFGEEDVGLSKISIYGQDSLLNKYLIVDGQLETRTIGINFNKRYQKDFPFLLKTYTASEFGEYIIQEISEINEGAFDQQDLYFIDLAMKK